MWFIVERYIPGIDVTEVRNAAQRLAATTTALAAEGIDVRYLGSSFIPGEESCFCRFESNAIEAVRSACDRSSFRYDRILEAEELTAPTNPLEHEESPSADPAGGTHADFTLCNQREGPP